MRLLQLRWAVALAALVVCVAVPAPRDVFYFGPALQDPPHQQQYSPAFYGQQSYQPYQPQPYQPYQAYQAHAYQP